MISSRRNYICNFRAPDAKHFQVWRQFKQAAKDRGLTTCYVILALCEAWLKGIQGIGEACQVVTQTQVINLQQQNTFVYGIEKPRREPLVLNCARKEYSRTITSRAWQAYITDRTRELERSISYRDFPELEHDFFRKCIMNLKKRGKIVPVLPRTNPRYYVLSENAHKYQNVAENNGVKPRFTQNPTEEMDKSLGQGDSKGA